MKEGTFFQMTFTAQEMKFSIKNFSVNVTKSAVIFNEKLKFSCSVLIRHTWTESGGIPLSVLSTWMMTIGSVS